MFEPIRCPYPSCRFHHQPPAGFASRRGSYHPHCRNQPVQRFHCRACERSFSRQSFRADYMHKKPHLNAPFLRLMVSCVALRQAARVLQVARRTVEHRFRWLTRHATLLQLNCLRGARLYGPFQLDELESFEHSRLQPLTVPVLIDRDTFFIVATEVGSLRRKGRLSPLQRRTLQALEAHHGRRASRSARSVRAVLSRLLLLSNSRAPIRLDSDQKPTYGRIGQSLFGSRFVWRAHPGGARRDRRNPLFPINHTNARLRHFLSRLRRRTWCVSKRGQCLQAHLEIAALWGNYCRGITNRTRTTPAQALRLAPRAYSPAELLGWRQDWGALSPPLPA